MRTPDSLPHSIHDDIEFIRGELFEDEILRNSRKAEEALDRLVEQLEAAREALEHIVSMTPSPNFIETAKAWASEGLNPARNPDA